MQHALVSAGLLLAFSLSARGESQGQPSPAGNVGMVVMLMKSLAQEIQVDGKNELSSYDKYACWCEDTLARKAKDISNAKTLIEELKNSIEKLKGEVAGHASEIQHLDKLMAENKESQREATEVRDNENADFEKEKTESEQCIGALEAAITVLSGAGTGKKKGFLETMQQAQALSVVSGVREVLKKATYSAKVSEKDLEFARDFFNNAGSSMFQRGRLSATQTGNNPFGDYAPQSDRITGILKGLYDTFAMDMEKDNVEEAEAQKSFQEFMDTKLAELKTLEETSENQQLSKATKEKTMSENKLLRSDTQAQLKADEEFFDTTKQGCKNKAKEWGTRVMMRTQELQGINKAVEILSNPEALKTFAASSEISLIQLSERSLKPVAAHQVVDSRKKVSKQSFAALQGLAKRFHSKSLDAIVAQVRAGGYFDKVIASIDKMIALLRNEEAMDIAHRDRCENANGRNKNELEDLDSSIKKAEASMQTMEHQAKTLNQEIDELKLAISATERNIDERKEMRNQERKQHEKSLVDDTNALALVMKAIDALNAFYKRNKLGLLQHKSKGPDYTVDGDKAPDTPWSEPYGGRKSENTGVVAILGMIAEDIKHEMAGARDEDMANQKEYEKENTAMMTTKDAQLATKMATETELSELELKLDETEDYRDSKKGDEAAQGKLKDAIYADCSWVADQFLPRAAARKTEMDGLQSAKAYLAGVAAGTELDP